MPRYVTQTLLPNVIWVVVSNIFYFHPYLGKIPNLTNIFQMDWNHQPVIYHTQVFVGPCFPIILLVNLSGLYASSNVKVWDHMKVS